MTSAHDFADMQERWDSNTGVPAAFHQFTVHAGAPPPPHVPARSTVVRALSVGKRRHETLRDPTPDARVQVQTAGSVASSFPRWGCVLEPRGAEEVKWVSSKSMSFEAVRNLMCDPTKIGAGIHAPRPPAAVPWYTAPG